MASTSPFVPGDGQQTPSIQPLTLFHAPGRTNPLLQWDRLFLVFYHYSYDYNLHSHSHTPIHKMELLFPPFMAFTVPWDWKNYIFFQPPCLQRGGCQSLGAGEGVVWNLGKWTPLEETHFPGVWMCGSQRVMNGATPAHVNSFTEWGSRLNMMKLEKECLLIIRTPGFDVGFVWGVEWGGFREDWGERKPPSLCCKRGAQLIISIRLDAAEHTHMHTLTTVNEM